jgi:LCP family protein required for cell wall assembly
VTDQRDQGDGEDRPYRLYRSGERDEREAPRPRKEPPRRDEGEAPARERREPAPDAAEQAPQGDPGYRVYRAKRGLRERLRPRDQRDQLREMGRRRGKDGLPKVRKPWTVGRVLKWVAIAIGSWILLSVILFFVSAQTAPGVSDSAKKALSGGGNLLTGSNVLVLGSDQRPAGFSDCTPGADCGGPSRADSIMLMHLGFGTVRKVSILRDSIANIPGHGVNKINAAYALGGTALMIRTVEQFMGNGLKVNHVVEVNFKDFPQFIDALGGIDVTLKKCVKNTTVKGGTISLKKGEHHLGGYRALKFARVRKNECDPGEDDRARAARQQQVLSGIRSSILSPGTFIRLPWVSWSAPRALRTDMHGPGLSLMFTDIMTGGSGKTRVLKPQCIGCGPVPGGLVVADSEKRRAVQELEGKR